MNEFGEITLCKKTSRQDCIGQAIDEALETRTIQCTVGSIERNEWSTAQQGGYEAEAMVKVFAASYKGESIAQYGGKTLEVYRTFKAGDEDEIELYLGTRIGDIP